MALNVGELFATINLQTDAFMKALDSCQTGVDALGQSLTTIGTKLTTTVTKAVKGAGQAILSNGMNFESQMSRVFAVGGAEVNEAADEITKKALEVAENTMWTAEQAGQALYYMGLAGWKDGQMLGGLEPIMNLASAAGEDLALVSDIVTDGMTAMGYSFERAQQEAGDAGDAVEVFNGYVRSYADVMAATATNTNTNIRKLGEAFKYVAPVAGAMQYSVEDLNLALGLMADSGIKSTMAGTALRNILTNMQSDSGQASEAVQALGLSLTDQNGEMYSLFEVMEQLRGSFKGIVKGDEQAIKAMEDDIHEHVQALCELEGVDEITDDEYFAISDAVLKSYEEAGLVTGDLAEKLKQASKLAGKRGMAGLLAILNATDERFYGLKQTIDSASQINATFEMQAKAMNNLKGDVLLFQSAMQSLEIRLYELFKDDLRGIVNLGTAFIKSFKNIDEAAQKTIVQFGAFSATIGPALILIGKTLPLALSPLGAVAAGISLIGLSAVDAGGTMNGLGVAVFNAAQDMASYINDFSTSFAKDMQRVNKNIPVLTGWLNESVKKIAPAITKVVGTVIAQFANTFSKNADRFVGFGQTILTSIIDGISKTVASTAPYLSDAVGSMATALVTALPKTLKSVRNFTSSVSKAIKAANIPKQIERVRNAVTKAAPSIISELRGVADDAKAVVGDIGTIAKDWITYIGSAFATFGPSLASMVTDVAVTVVEGFGSVLTGLSANNTIKNTITTWAIMVKENVPRVLSAFTGLALDIGRVIAAELPHAAKEITGVLSTVFSSLGNTVKELFDSGVAADILHSIVGSITANAGELASGITSLATTIVTSIISMGPDILTSAAGIISAVVDAVMNIDWLNVFNQIRDSWDTGAWVEAGKKLWNAVKAGFKSLGTLAQMLILGDDYNADDSWQQAGVKVFNKLKDGIGKLPEIVASILDTNYDPATDSAWSTIGSKIHEGLKNGFLGLKDLLGYYFNGDSYKPEEDINWQQVGAKVHEGIKSGLKGLQDLLDGFFGEAYNPQKHGWAGIGALIRDRIKTGLGNLQGFIGALFMGPAYDPEQHGWYGIGRSIFDRLQAGLQDIQTFIGGLFKGPAYNPDADGWHGIGEGIVDAIKGGLGTVAEMLSGFFSDLSISPAQMFALFKLGGSIVKLISSPINATAILAGLVFLSDMYDPETKGWRSLGTSIYTTISNALNLDGIKEMLVNFAFDGTTETYTANSSWEVIGEGIGGKVMDGLRTVLTGLTNALKLLDENDTFGKVTKDVMDFAHGLLTSITKALPVALQEGFNGIDYAVNIVGDLLDALIKGVNDIFTDKGILNDTGESIATLIEGVFNSISNVLSNIETVSFDFGTMVANVAEGLLVALLEVVKKTKWDQVLVAIGNAIGDSVVALIDVAEAVIVNLCDYLTDPDNLFLLLSAGVKLADGLIRGILGGIGALASKIMDKIGELLGYKNKSNEVNEAGERIGLLLNNGIEKGLESGSEGFAKYGVTAATMMLANVRGSMNEFVEGSSQLASNIKKAFETSLNKSFDSKDGKIDLPALRENLIIAISDSIDSAVTSIQRNDFAGVTETKLETQILDAFNTLLGTSFETFGGLLDQKNFDIPGFRGAVVKFLTTGIESMDFSGVNTEEAKQSLQKEITALFSMLLDEIDIQAETDTVMGKSQEWWNEFFNTLLKSDTGSDEEKAAAEIRLMELGADLGLDLSNALGEGLTSADYDAIFQQYGVEMKQSVGDALEGALSQINSADLGIDENAISLANSISTSYKKAILTDSGLAGFKEALENKISNYCRNLNIETPTIDESFYTELWNAIESGNEGQIYTLVIDMLTKAGAINTEETEKAAEEAVAAVTASAEMTVDVTTAGGTVDTSGAKAATEAAAAKETATVNMEGAVTLKTDLSESQGTTIGQAFIGAVNQAISDYTALDTTMTSKASSARGKAETELSETHGDNIGNTFGTALNVALLRVGETIILNAANIANLTHNNFKNILTAVAGTLIGTTYGSALNSELLARGATLIQNAGLIANLINNNFKNILSAVAGNAIGNIYASAINSAIVLKSATTIENASLIASLVKGGFANVLTNAAGFNIGANFVYGMGDGIESLMSWLSEKAGSVAQAAVTSAKATLNEQSPSKVTYEMGEYFTEGLGLGIVGKVESAIDSARGIANAVIETVNDTLDIHSPAGTGILAGAYYGEGFEIGLRQAGKDCAWAAKEVALETAQMVTKYTKDGAEKATGGLVNVPAEAFKKGALIQVKEVTDTVEKAAEETKKAISKPLAPDQLLTTWERAETTVKETTNGLVNLNAAYEKAVKQAQKPLAPSEMLTTWERAEETITKAAESGGGLFPAATVEKATQEAQKAVQDAASATAAEAKESAKQLEKVSDAAQGAADATANAAARLHEAGEYYSRVMQVVDIDTLNDLVTLMDMVSGRTWKIGGARNFEEDAIGDLMSVILQANETASIFDDELVKYRYGGTVEQLQNASEDVFYKTVDGIMKIGEELTDLDKVYSGLMKVTFFDELNNKIHAVDAAGTKWILDAVDEISDADIGSLITVIKKQTGDAFNDAIVRISSFDGLLNTSENAAKEATTGIKDVLANSGAGEAVANTMNEWISEANGIEFGEKFIGGIIKGIHNKIQELVQMTEDAAMAAVGIIREVLGINSPSEVTWKIGEYLVEGLAFGILDEIKLAVSSAATLATSVLEAMNIPSSSKLGSDIANELSVPLKTKAESGATEGQNITNYNNNSPLIVQEMNVRKESDINAIAQELNAIRAQTAYGYGS